MTPERKYKILLASVTVVAIYLCLTEVHDRWSAAISSWQEIAEREKLPEAAEIERMRTELLFMRKALLAQAVDKPGNYEQTQTGVFRFLSDRAQAVGIRYESLVPAESESRGQVSVVGFEVKFSTGFHRIGKWINLLETGPIPISLSSMRISSENARSSRLKADIRGSAFIFQNTAGQ